MYCLFLFYGFALPLDLHSFPTRRSSDLRPARASLAALEPVFEDARSGPGGCLDRRALCIAIIIRRRLRSEEHTSELQSRQYLVCRLLLEKKKYIGRRCKSLTASVSALVY